MQYDNNRDDSFIFTKPGHCQYEAAIGLILQQTKV